MSNIIKKGTSVMVPKDIADMTLGDLMSSKDVEIHKKDNVLKIKRRTTSETIMLEIRSFDDTSIVSQSKTNRDRPFSQMKKTIAKLRAEGKTQAEVADILGTTQTNISKIEKKMKKRK
ncbi:hypothetical protein [Sharpea azabuensis]|uniref:hypothetical protein n=1 Tax=Sharpea azabuensis TaxID=322505 RepID=UPI00240A9415|nr:hypothetical protein [Sharpea azabuensis]MDD6511980.1 hypothetical protein [Sharpea azabuensis]